MKAIADVQQIQGMVRERNMLFNALVNLFQACSELCWEDMDKLEKQIAEASYAIKHAAQQSVQPTAAGGSDSGENLESGGG